MRRRIIRARNNPHRNTGRFRQPPQLFSPSPLRKSRNAASSSAKNPSTEEQGTTVVSHTASTLSFSSTLPTTTRCPPSFDNVPPSLNVDATSGSNKQRLRVLQLEQELANVNRCISDLQKRVRRMENNSYRSTIPRNGSNPYRNTKNLLTSWKNSNCSPEEVANGVFKAICETRYLRDDVCQAILANDVFFKDVKKHYESKMYEELRYKFRGWICLQQIDMNPTVSFRSYEVIRRTEFVEDATVKYQRGLLQSRHKLGRLCRQLETYGQQLIPYDITGNSVKFDVERAIQFLLEKHSLWGFVRQGERVVMAATVDGGELSWNVTQVSAGVKIVDPRAKDPVSGGLLFGESGHDRVQSQFHCYPLHIIIAKDNKNLYQTHLSSFFREVNRFEELHPGLDIAQEADMCSLIKTLGKGGAMKLKKIACYCCNIHRDDLVKPMDVPCTDCVRLGRRERPCYHTTICDEALLERLREEREEMASSWPHLQHLVSLKGRSRVRWGNSGDAVYSSRSDPLHIDFEPRSRQDRVSHRNLLDAEARLRGFNDFTRLSIGELKINLQEILIIEARYELLCHIFEASNLNEAMIRLEQALPCLLHLENRSSETIIEFLLCKGLSLREGNRQSTAEFINGVQNIMNQQIFGSVGCSSNWTFPINEDGTMGKVKLANWRARRVILEIEEIAVLCLPGDERLPERNKWLSAITAYRSTIQVSFQVGITTSS